MKRVLSSGGAILLLLGAGGCAGVSRSVEERPLDLFPRIALLFERYNDALARSDEARCAELGAELTRLVDSRFEEVAEGLAGKDAQIQCDAAFALGFSRRREAAERLMQAIRNPLPGVRANAVAALGMLAREDVPEGPFLDLLGDPEPKVRQAALAGLRFLLADGRDRGFLGRIHEKLSDPSPAVRNEALIVLRRLRRKESVPVILERSVKDPEPLVRANAAAALGAMGTNAFEATPVLIEMLRDEFPQVVGMAWVALKAIHQKELDRSYGSWRGWYEEEIQHLYVCPEHREVEQAFPGECPRCKARLERIPIEVARKRTSPAGPFACPDHPDILTQTPGRCGRPGCGKDLVPVGPPRGLYACPDHPEVVTATPGQCGKCGKVLAPREPDPTLYGCPVHPEVQTLTPGRCGKPGCGRDLVPKKQGGK